MTRAGRRLAVLVVALVLGACFAPPDDAALRVMTWNVQTLAHDPDEWAPVVARERPDVLALQEICAPEAFALADLLRRDHGLAYDVVPGPIRPPTPDEEGAPVNAALGPVCGTAPDTVEFGLAVLSRLPVRDASVTVYPPDRRDEQRGFLTVELGAGLTVVTTHVGLAGVQTDQIHRLADAAGSATPAVVLGDLNVPVGSPDLAPLRRAFTEIDPTGRYPTTAEKIDYIFLRGLAVVGEPETPAVAASDHRPLIGELTP